MVAFLIISVSFPISMRILARVWRVFFFFFFFGGGGVVSTAAAQIAAPIGKSGKFVFFWWVPTFSIASTAIFQLFSLYGMFLCFLGVHGVSQQGSRFSTLCEHLRPHALKKTIILLCSSG